MQYLISKKLWRVLLWIRIYINSFLNLLVWVSAMQCNVECRLHEEDVKLKNSPSEGALVGGTGGLPPSYAPVDKCWLDLISVLLKRRSGLHPLIFCQYSPRFPYFFFIFYFVSFSFFLSEIMYPHNSKELRGGTWPLDLQDLQAVEWCIFRPTHILYYTSLIYLQLVFQLLFNCCSRPSVRIAP